MKTSTVSTVLAFVLLTAACGKSEGSKSSSSPETSGTSAYVTNKSLETWEKLLVDGHSQYAVAERLSSLIAEGDRENVKRYLKQYTATELKDLISEIKQFEAKTRKRLMYGLAPFQQDERFLRGTLMKRPALLANSNYSIENSIRLSVAVREKNKFLTSIFETYNGRINEIARDVAPVVAAKLVRQQDVGLRQALGEGMFNANRRSAIKRLARLVLEVDVLQLYMDEGLEVRGAVQNTVATFIAEAILDELIRSGNLDRLVGLGQRVEDAQAQVNEAIVLATAMQKHLRQVDAYAQEAKILVKQLDGASMKMISTLRDDKFREDVIYPVVIDYAADRILNHSSFGAEVKKGVARVGKVVENIDLIIHTSENLSKNASGMLNDFTTILETTQILSKNLGIKLPKGVNKLVSDVQRINEIVKGGQAVLAGFTAGGPVGAFIALSSGPAAKLLSGGASVPSFESTVMAQFKVINAKLDALLEGQAQIMSLQKDTMKMISDLAMMVDEQHHETLSKLNAVHYDLKALFELEQNQRLQPIKDCERMITNQIQIDFRSHKNPVIGLDANTAVSLAQQLSGKLQDRPSILEFIKSTSARDFENCRYELSSTFGDMGTSREARLRKVYEANGKINGYFLEEVFYAPLYDLLPRTNELVAFEKGLHLPFLNVSDLETKLAYVNRADLDTHEVLDLQFMLSSEGLIRYASNLLVMYPYLEFEREDWESGIEQLLRVQSSGSSDAQKLLKGALVQTQVAIAQEALLAGEPILDKVGPILLSSYKNGGDVQSLEDQQAAVRLNPVLLRNYIMYKVRVENKNSPLADIGAYKKSYEARDLRTLDQILFDGKLTAYVRMSGDKVVLKNSAIYSGVTKVSRDIELPTPEEMAEGRILYSPNMPRLIDLQEKLIDALVMNTGDLKTDHKKMIANILMGKNY